MSQDRLAKMQQRILGMAMEELQGWMNDLLKDALDPAKVVAFMRSMGLDMSHLPGTMSQQRGFDPYRVLGLDKSASDEEVKNRYRELVFKLHPDQSGTQGTNFLFQIVVAAYEMINRERR